MYVITVKFETTEESKDAFRKAVLQQARNSLTKESGCRRFDVCRDPENDTRFFLYEIYDDKAAFERHLQTAHYDDFDAKIKEWVILKNPQGWELIEE